MKLFLNKPSPYARLVLVVAHEKGLAARIELAWTDPWKNPRELVEANPFSRVPTLVTDDAGVLVDSACICDYLDHLGAGRRLMPEDPRARTAAMRKLGMARTLTDASFGAVIERRFNAGAEPELAARWLAAAKGALDAFETDGALTGDAAEPDLGDLALAVALGYIEFRLQEMDWRPAHPRLARWFDSMSRRESMRATPHE